MTDVKDVLMVVEQELKASHDAQRSMEAEGNAWIPEWYLRVLGGIEQAKKAIKQRAEELTRQLDNRAGHLDYLYGDALRAEADKMIAQETKKKSKKLLTGTVGYRTNKGRLLITDMEKTVVWVVKNLEVAKMVAAVKGLDVATVLPHLTPELIIDAVTDLRITPLKEHLETTGELPDGCELSETTETFYATPAVAKLKGGE